MASEDIVLKPGDRILSRINNRVATVVSLEEWNASDRVPISGIPKGEVLYKTDEMWCGYRFWIGSIETVTLLTPADRTEPGGQLLMF